MTTEQLLGWAQEHIAWIVGGAVTWLVGISATIAVATFQNVEQQKILDDRAPAVIELGRVAQQVNSEASANTEFRADTRRRLDRIEDKLDKALEK